MHTHTQNHFQQYNQSTAKIDSKLFSNAFFFNTKDASVCGGCMCVLWFTVIYFKYISITTYISSLYLNLSFMFYFHVFCSPAKQFQVGGHTGALFYEQSHATTLIGIPIRVGLFQTKVVQKSHWLCRNELALEPLLARSIGWSSCCSCSRGEAVGAVNQDLLSASKSLPLNQFTNLLNLPQSSHL